MVAGPTPMLPQIGKQTSQENKIRDTYTCSKDNYISKTSLLAILHDFV